MKKNKGDVLLTAKRYALIRQLIYEKSMATVAELAKRCNVSEVTIRRDLINMEQDGIISRVRGGAILVHSASDYLMKCFEKQCILHHAEKQLIGAAAAALVKSNETIIIDHGSTALELVKNLAKVQGLTVFTPSILIAEKLEGYNAITTILTGGTLRTIASCLLNPMLDKSLQSVVASKAFLGVDAISVQHGLTTSNFAEADVKKTLISHAQEVIVLADSSKLDQVSPAFIAPLEQVHTLVTDDKADDSIVEVYRRLNIKTIVASSTFGMPDKNNQRSL
jgi:DeoR/GlpR family transcriptional regulator of sugar metabolism